MSKLLVKKSLVIDGKKEKQLDVLVDQEKGLIIEVADHIDSQSDITINANGLYLTPGFVDMHTHLRQPGKEKAETILSGSRAAARGGYTAVVAMPNTEPCMDSAGVINQVRHLANSALCDVYPSAAISKNREGEELVSFSSLVDAGVKLFTDDGTGVQDSRFMKTALEYAKSVQEYNNQKIIFAQHCEVSSLSNGGYMHEGAWSSQLGLGGQPREAEDLMVERDIMLAKSTGMHIHFMHISTEGSVELIRKAKAAGVSITAEATPHHFSLTDAMCQDYETVYKVHPPLRESSDVLAVIQGLSDGTIDAIATDHAPHETHLKDVPFDEAPPGMIGLETAFGVAKTFLGFEIQKLVELLSVNPARILNLKDHGQNIEPGSVANLALINLDESWVVEADDTASLSRNNPFVGRKLTGKVKSTIYRGEIVVNEGAATR